MSDSTPLLRDEVNVLHDTPREDDDQVGGDDDSGML